MSVSSDTTGEVEVLGSILHQTSTLPSAIVQGGLDGGGIENCFFLVCLCVFVCETCQQSQVRHFFEMLIGQIQKVFHHWLNPSRSFS